MFRGLLVGAVGLAACQGSTSLAIDPGCNPLGVGGCLAPWPSSAFEVDDATTATGRRLAIPDDAIPRGASDTAIDPALWNALDGFSPATPILLEIPDGISPQGLPSADNMDLSLAADSPTVILDVTSGERVAHHAEVDESGTVLILRPAARLAFGHRYAVALTTRVLAADGEELPISPGFRALRDDRRTDHPLLEAMRGRIDEVFDALDTAGVVDDLILAWDFTVASEASTRADLVVAAERAATTRADHPSLFTITRSTPVVGARQLAGTLDGPLVLSNGGEARANTRLVRDDGGLPAIQGLYRIPFAAVVPACANGAVVLWGHGDATEVHRQTGLAGELCAVVIAIDHRGHDLPAIRRAADDLASAGELDTLLQGVIDHATLLAALKGMLADPRFGAIVLDPARVFYAGDHLAVAALPELARATVQERRPSIDLTRYERPIDALLVRALIDARWDRLQPARVPHPVLIHGSGESTSWLARTFGLPIVDPASIPWGVKTQREPARSGVVLDAPVPLREFFTTGLIRAARGRL